MRHSLLSRFQGTLLSAALGDELEAYSRLGQPSTPEGTTGLEQDISALAPANLTSWRPGNASGHSASTSSAPWGSAATSCARVLVQAGSWNELEMAAIGVRLAADRLATDRLVVDAALGQSRTRTSITIAECALATLPLVLFFHDNEIKQQQLLMQTAKLWQRPPGTEVGLLAFGFAVAQMLQERLERLTLLPQTIAYLKQSTAKPTASLLDLVSRLEQVQTLLHHGAALHPAIEQLRAGTTQSDSTAIAIAFYCFLSTPDDLRLSLLRAARSGDVAPVVCALTGALSGAHNGLNGLPLVWQMSNSIPLLWGLSGEEMNQLAARLFAVWSGVYASGTATNVLAIAAPGVIRPR